MEPTAFELAPLEASQSPSPHIQTAPLLAGGGGGISQTRILDLAATIVPGLPAITRR
jgi:hypothetical protein